jgi:signal transduction histidine kinase
MAGQGGGTVFLRIFETREGETHYVACQVTDTGPGIPDELMATVFNPFFTTKTQGPGLGLSIVQKIVDRYGGQLSVANHPEAYPGSGASFTFMFPAVSGP